MERNTGKIAVFIDFPLAFWFSNAEDGPYARQCKKMLEDRGGFDYLTCVNELLLRTYNDGGILRYKLFVCGKPQLHVLCKIADQLRSMPIISQGITDSEFDIYPGLNIIGSIDHMASRPKDIERALKAYDIVEQKGVATRKTFEAAMTEVDNKGGGAAMYGKRIVHAAPTL